MLKECGGCVQIRKSVRKGLKGIIDKVGVTSILVTHDQEEAFDLADQIVIFNRCPPNKLPATCDPYFY